MIKSALIATGITVALIFIALFLLQKNNATKSTGFPETGTNPQNTNVTSGAKIATFSGKISMVDTGCLSGLVCSITIGGKKIILLNGLPSQQAGATIGQLRGVNSYSDLKDQAGSFASVYVELTPGGDYTIYGNSSYYVEVIALGYQ